MLARVGRLDPPQLFHWSLSNDSILCIWYVLKSHFTLYSHVFLGLPLTLHTGTSYTLTPSPPHNRLKFNFEPLNIEKLYIWGDDRPTSGKTRWAWFRLVLLQLTSLELNLFGKLYDCAKCILWPFESFDRVKCLGCVNFYCVKTGRFIDDKELMKPWFYNNLDLMTTLR